ncbi:DUF2064 domain-containing protein [bacterium]|nr:DUF2064 domain-containing protein [bacterium]NBX83100.1 DUF2064 domain-containing protein [bacterium]
MSPFHELSIVIPVGKEETSVSKLLEQLKPRSSEVEIICVGVSEKPKELPPEIKWLKSEPGRAQQMNRGALEARGSFLWFLHADSEVAEIHFQEIEKAMKSHPDSLSFFTLAFQERHPGLFLNELGTRFRSRVLGLPFGDQGFLMSKQLFWKCGGYPENTAYGEDHLLVWKAKKTGIRLNPFSEKLKTSGRKYFKQGWLRTTFQHLFLTYLQVGRELVKKRKGKCAVAVFVKTPGLSPLKTRLAEGVGKARAEEFYLESVKEVERVLKSLEKDYQDFVPLWAVAEGEGMSHSLWNGFDRLFQGTGSLGDRLNQVYSTLIEKYEAVILIGADCPQIQKRQFLEAQRHLKNKNCGFVLGPAFDGGFYLFAGKNPIPKMIWTQVKYSQGTTLQELKLGLQNMGSIDFLGELRDVDNADDLLHYLERKTL